MHTMQTNTNGTKTIGCSVACFKPFIGAYVNIGKLQLHNTFSP